MNRTIATQTELKPLQDALSSVAGNLNAHINQTLSKAHGVEVIPGYFDAAGNNLNNYQNSNGDVVGNYIIRFNIAGVIYYAPAMITTLAGQPPTTGSLDLSGQVPSEDAPPGASSLITDYTSVEVQSANEVNNLLLAHTVLPHETAHGPLVAFAKNTYDSNGHIVGTYVIQIDFNGLQYELPCDTRFGGPLQPPRIYPFVPGSYSGNSGSGSNIQNQSFEPNAAGTQPLTYAYQYWSGSVWVDMPPDSPQEILFYNVGTTFEAFYSSTTGLFTFYSGFAGGNNYGIILIRVIVSGPGGTTSLGVNGQPVVFQYGLQNHAGKGGWFCTQANTTKQLSVEDWRILSEVEAWVYKHKRSLLVFYLRKGDHLVNRMLVQGVPQSYFEDLVGDVLARWDAAKPEIAATYYMDHVMEDANQYWPDWQKHVLVEPWVKAT